MPKQHTFARIPDKPSSEVKPEAASLIGVKFKNAGKPTEAAGAVEIVQGLGELVEAPWLALLLLPYFACAAWSRKRLR